MFKGEDKAVRRMQRCNGEGHALENNEGIKKTKD